MQQLNATSNGRIKHLSIMAEPLSPDHVFDFLAVDPILDLEDPIMEVKEDPEEEPEEDPEEVIPLVTTSHPGSSPIIPLPLSEYFVRYNSLPLLLLTGTTQGASQFGYVKDFEVEVFIKHDATRTSDDVLALQEGRAKDQEKIRKLERRVDALEVSNTLAAMDQDRMERETMPPRRLKGRAVERLMANRVAKAIAEYERNKTNPKGARGNAGGDTSSEVRRCSYKTFLNCKPHSFNETEGVVGLSRWFEKMVSMFEISKCAEEDKVKYVVCTLEGHALTWWNGNVHSLGINDANKIP
ncbi:hypothetical protein Tco_0319928 [Tanacetum coccineum]